MVEILFQPHPERVATTNAWAFLHWLRVTRGVELPDWTALVQWSGTDAVGFSAAVAEFARLPQGHDPSRPLREGVFLTCSVAEVLLHADVRPDDRLLVVGPEWPWNAARLNGTIVVHASAADVLGAAAEAQATVLVCPAQALADAAFQRPRRRPDLASLRTIIATGGPLSPEGRRRIYTWVKPDVMLLARTGDTFWGNPLEPVLARPPATPAFLTPRVSAPPPG